MASHPGPPAGAVRRTLGALWLRLMGWSLAPTRPTEPRAVFVAAPHTSNWDLPLAIAVAWALDIKLTWAGKHTIFRFPFGPLMRALGGVPIDRRHRGNQVEMLASLFADGAPRFVAIAPSGTRSKRDHWKSGFYHVATRANVPVQFAFLHYPTKTGGLGPVVTLTGDVRADMDRVRAFYSEKRGKHPEQESTVRLREEDPATVGTPPAA